MSLALANKLVMKAPWTGAEQPYEAFDNLSCRSAPGNG